MAKTVRLSTTQVAWQGGPEEANPYSERFSLEAAREHARASIDSHAAVVAKAGELGAELTVTGEAIDGTGNALTYVDDPSIFRDLVGETSPYVHDVMSALAKQHAMHVVACFYEQEGDLFYNSAVLWGRDGNVIGRYHKVNLPIYETWLVQRGDSFPVFETDIAPIGLMICYDEMWPEVTATLAMNGARIVCHPSAASPPEWKCKCRAMDEQIFYVTSTGQGSRITAPNATILADAGEQATAVVTADVDLETATLSPDNFWEYIYSGVQCHRERHLRLRQAGAYDVLSDPNPPALQNLPEGGLNDTPEKVWAAYEKQKEEYRRGLRGERGRYGWRWSEEGRGA
jgi:predicted amidohydrolase